MLFLAFLHSRLQHPGFLVAGLKTLRCSLNLKSRMTPYSTSALCISSGKGCTSHRSLSSQPLVFLCCSSEYCWVDITMLTTEHKYVSGGTHAAFLSLCFPFFLPTYTLTEALSCDISLLSSGQMHQRHVRHHNSRSRYNKANTALVSRAAQFVY